jgi:hypothetical protein
MRVVVNNPQLRNNARRLSERINTENGAAQVVSRIESLLIPSGS